MFRGFTVVSFIINIKIEIMANPFVLHLHFGSTQPSFEIKLNTRPKVDLSGVTPISKATFEFLYCHSRYRNFYVLVAEQGFNILKNRKIPTVMSIRLVNYFPQHPS